MEIDKTAGTDELGRRLLTEGARLLAEQGPAGLSLRKLAALAGTSTMAVYTRFGDKPRLIAAMYREGFRRLGEELERAAGDDPLTALASVGLAYRAAAVAEPNLYHLMFGRPVAGFEPDESDQEAAGATYEPLLQGVRTAVQHGVLVGDPERIAVHLWSVAHGMVSLELAGYLPPGDAQELYAQALGLAVTPFLPGAVTPG